MKKTIIILCSCAATMLLTQCAKKNTIGHKSAQKKTPAEQITEAKAKYTAEQIAQGNVIFNNKCGECHELKQPGEYTVKSWNKILPDMVRKAKIKDPDAGMLNAWVIVNAKAG